MLVWFSQPSASFSVKNVPQLIIIHCAYYLGEFTGSKVCLLVTQKEEVLCSVKLWWMELFR